MKETAAVPISYSEAAGRIHRALGARPARRLSVAGFRPAAVLVPVLHRPSGPTLLFTRRTETLAQHAGQISFPGGRCEHGEDAGAAALREALEEVGLPPGRVLIAGCLDDCASVSRYIVTPVVGLVPEPPAVFRAQESEVLEPFEVPLERLLDGTRFRSEWWDPSRMPPGAPVETLLGLRSPGEDFDAVRRRYRVHFFQADPLPERTIWGLTARILKELLDRAFCFSGPQRAR